MSLLYSWGRGVPSYPTHVGDTNTPDPSSRSTIPTARPWWPLRTLSSSQSNVTPLLTVLPGRRPQRRHCEGATRIHTPGTQCPVGSSHGQACESSSRPTPADLPRETRCHHQSLVYLQEAQVEPARQAQVPTGKRNEANYCSTEGHGHTGSLEAEVVSVWARKGSEVETRAAMEPLLGPTRNHS